MRKERNGGTGSEGKLRLSADDLRVESFDLRGDGTGGAGTVRGHANTQDPSCAYGSCVPTVCGSCGEATCGVTCGPPNYGCDSVDPRCTHGGVYPC